MLPPNIFSIGIGTDLCRISRIYKSLTANTGIKFIQRVLTPEEINSPRAFKILKCILEHDKSGATIASPVDIPTPGRDREMTRAAEYMAGRFAAKEAVIKAYSQRKIYFRDIVVTYEHNLTASNGDWEQSSYLNTIMPEENNQRSPPVAIIKGDSRHKDVYARLSISHDGDYALAMCLAFLKDPNSSES